MRSIGFFELDVIKIQGGTVMDDNRLLPLQQQLIAAHQEVRECNGYSQQFGLTLSEPEITELVDCAHRAESNLAAVSCRS